MFIGSHETAQRVLGGKYRGAVTLLTRRLQAGGPGSGCHGPNCGRPEGATTKLANELRTHPAIPIKERKPHGPRAAGILKQMGWKKAWQQEGRLPHWKKGVGAHTTTKYVSKYGIIIVNHSGGFKHIDKDGNVLTRGSGQNGFQRLGKNAIGLQEYLNRLQNQQHGIQEKKIIPVGDLEHSDERLKSLKITSSKQLGGGVNFTKKVTFEDGSFGVFKKSTTGEDKNEVAAWQVAKVVGMMDMVSPAIMTELDGRKGSLLKWVDGKVAAESTDPWDGKDQGRAAAFDFVIGNSDRHMGNWLTDDAGKLHLIDHGLAFRGEPSMYRGFLWHVRNEERDGFRAVASPKDHSKPYVDNKEQIVAVLTKLKIPTEGVVKRIRQLSEAENWRDLQGW